MIVASAALNTARVADRVERGGHDVPPNLVAARRERSIGMMSWFAERAMIENSSRPVVLAGKNGEDAAWRVYDAVRLGVLGLTLPP